MLQNLCSEVTFSNLFLMLLDPEVCFDVNIFEIEMNESFWGKPEDTRSFIIIFIDISYRYISLLI